MRGVSVCTTSDDGPGGNVVTMGDHKATSTEEPVSSVESPKDEQQQKAAPTVTSGLALPTGITMPGAFTVPTGPAVSTSEPASEEKPAKTNSPPASPSRAFEFGASFVCDSTHDGTVVAPNEVFSQTWTLHNPGPLAWPVGSVVRYVGGDSMLNVDTNEPSSVDNITSAMESNKLEAPLEPGQDADFTVSLKAPNREGGTAISYWRLKLPDGTPVGDRLWCDIDVASKGEPVQEDGSNKEVSGNDSSNEKKAEQVHSGMIFPLLEKESPVTSTHEEMKGENVSRGGAEKDDDIEGVEDMTLDEDTDGFLTDEEYDILDASDQEFMDSAQGQN